MRRQWLEKQEKAFQIWLNALLTPQAAAPEDDGGLAAKRLYARVQGQIWHMYCSDPGVIGVMTRLEKRVDEGFLRMKAEVCSERRVFCSRGDDATAAFSLAQTYVLGTLAQLALHYPCCRSKEVLHLHGAVPAPSSCCHCRHPRWGT